MEKDAAIIKQDTDSASRGGDAVLLLAVLCSGFSALGYELLWTKLLALVLGSESIGVLGVLAGFFGGMVLGACCFHEPIRRARHPLRFFAVFESVAAAYAVASPRLLYWLGDVLPSRIGPVAGNNDSILALTLATAIAGCVMLPATVCLGGTLAAVVEAWRRCFRQDPGSKGLGRLYGANTAGGALGVAASVYVILPGLGLLPGSAFLALIGLVSACLALLWNRCTGASASAAAAVVKDGEVSGVNGAKGKAFAGQKGQREERVVPPAQAEDRKSGRAAYILVFGTGLAGIGLEVICVLLMSVILDNTVYTFANILAVYLVGTAVGAWLYQRLLKHGSLGRSDSLIAALLLSLALTVGLVAVLVKAGPAILAHLAPFNASYVRHLMSEIVFAGIIFAVPTVLMGALFSHLVGMFTSRGVGKAYGLNMLGGMLAPFVFGLAGIRIAGLSGTLYLVMFLYLFLAIVWMLLRRTRLQWVIAGVLSVAGVWALAPSELNLVRLGPGWRVNERREGLMGVVTVAERQGGAVTRGTPIRMLKVNQLFRMGGSGSFSENRMGHMTWLLAPNAKEALFLGVGTGTTLGTVREYPLEQVDAVEIVPQVLDVIRWFDDSNNGVRKDHRISLYPADARRFAAASKKHYDLIVGDLFHPARDGAGNLYSLEHFENLSRHLTDQGIVAQWIPLYQFDVENLKTVIRTFLAAFEDVHSFIGLYNAERPPLLLVGKNPQSEAERFRIDVPYLRHRLAPDSPAGRAVEDERDFLASYFLDRRALEAYAGDGPVNSDLNPVLLFNVPGGSYGQHRDTGFASLSSLLPYRMPVPAALLGGLDDASRNEMAKKVENRFRAVGLYLQADVLRVTSASGSVTADMLDMYIEAYRADADFAPARGQLITEVLSDPDRARRIYPHLNSRDKARIDGGWGK